MIRDMKVEEAKFNEDYAAGYSDGYHIATQEEATKYHDIQSKADEFLKEYDRMRESGSIEDLIYTDAAAESLREILSKEVER